MSERRAPESKFELAGLLEAAGRRMKHDLRERLISHPGELGIDREEVIRRFLRHYLPRKFEVSSGFAFDCKGAVSNQLDIVITNSLICPRFETAGGTRYFPCESIVAAGQVKSALTSKQQLKDAFANLESVKSLDRSADGHAIDVTRDELLDPQNNHLHQIFTFIFIIGKALDGETARGELIDHTCNTEAHLWPNVIFASDKYLLTFCCQGGVCPNPLDALGIALQPASPDQDILIRFYLLLSQALEVTRATALPYSQYLKTFTSWSPDIIYPRYDDGPQLLRGSTR